MALRRSLVGIGSISTSLAVAAYYYRPDPSEKMLEIHPKISRRLKSPKVRQNLCDDSLEADPLLLQGARGAVITTVAVISKVVLLGFNNTRLIKDDRYARLVELVRNRQVDVPQGEPLLTVANHTSTLDDPSLFGVMMPWDVVLRHKLMRWTACTQEICFDTPVLAAIFGAGKVLPVERGAGVDQTLLLDFSRRLAAGNWCHVFPEGKTVQTGNLGGRSPPASQEVGILKWGVGKMIAHSPHTPRVIPFFHTGMQDMVAEDPATKDVLPGQPNYFNNDITLRVGDPIDVSDLIAKHESEHGPLWKYSASVTKGGADDEASWKSCSPVNRRLYSAITLRIEEALLALEAEARKELGTAYPTTPKLVANGEYLKLLGKQ
ncbi:unnamed protein product [Ascophyllum nodosum]